jgi:glutathione peroxidase
LDVATAQARSIYEVELPRLDGKPARLSEYEGKVVLAVNVASRCGFTPQYAGLQALSERYADRGLVVLGFPCNQFFNQEPGSADKIQEFCSVNYGVTFPLMSKVEVNGAKAHPLFVFLKDRAAGGKGKNIKWNFTKFLVGRDGRSVQRFESATGPLSLVKEIEAALSV